MLDEQDSERIWRNKQNSLYKIKADLKDGKKRLQMTQRRESATPVRKKPNAKPRSVSRDAGVEDSWQMAANRSVESRARVAHNDRAPQTPPRVVYDQYYSKYLQQRYPRLATTKNNSGSQSHVDATLWSTLAPLPYYPLSVPNPHLRPSSARELSEQLSSDPLLAESIVSNLLQRFLEDDLVPDVLIETVQEMSGTAVDEEALLYSLSSPKERQEVQVHQGTLMVLYHDIVREVLTSMTLRVAVDQLDEAWEEARRLDERQRWVASEVLYELIDEEIASHVRQNVRQLARDELSNVAVYEARWGLLQEVVAEMLPSIVRSSLGEAFLESILDDVMDPVLKEEAASVAEATMAYYQVKLKRWDVSQVRVLLGGKPLNSLALDHILSRVVDQHAVYGPAEPVHRELEDLALKSVLDETDALERNMSATLSNYGMKRFHEKVFTDIALDMLTKDLISHVDGDLCDLDTAEVDRLNDATVRKYTHHVDELYL